MKTEAEIKARMNELSRIIDESIKAEHGHLAILDAIKLHMEEAIPLEVLAWVLSKSEVSSSSASRGVGIA